ncbi:tRNA pseudouridine32 synthase / 23S rRNA pseudouridine746 synthase [Sphingobacterium nematocida]|uniref:tRNA pseudouridine32 synthase / 23S rRNA pseudouridine746 synthase n=1 Tax=Sphingobacterium nematocida TaxID=1513896 RepID=A0A1T5C628_9SPHI|nr:RluA family pseudouridine synthase [Sphingobacterium nematocida]SKB55052.1 tRNA pseudouridine32 synthase / 23S rRNA pseudouridine746 synthase [Sphingobacterium nematocida]
MKDSTPFFHLFKQDITALEKPDKFTFPFCYEPDALSLLAAEELQDYLTHQQDFEHNFGLVDGQQGSPIGKMFGVLVVEDQQGTLGYLAACSGKLAGTNIHKHLVPPLFDMLNPEGFFLQQEAIINKLNREIEILEEMPDIPLLRQRLQETQRQTADELSNLRIHHKQNKSKRKTVRNEQKPLLSEEDYTLLEQDLVKQSYRDQHEYDVLKQNSKEAIAFVENQLQDLLVQISDRKEQRKQLSANLQQQLFDQYIFLDAQGHRKSLLPIFEEALQMLPPAGAGECAAPKLLQHAYLNNLKPVCMAEFWWGTSPSSEIRKHRYFYPACKGKCEPILSHMLQGLSVAPNPLLENPADNKELPIIFEDNDIIVVNKPEEFLSVPGIHVQDSVQTRILQRNPEITGPLIIHRLDMSTSGILVLAKNKEAHQFIQDQFIRHTVKKRYTALLDGIINEEKGLIDFPMRVDLEDRPRQVLCYEHGKNAQTQYQVVAIEGNKTRIHYFPLTGRTHQLRVHSAHQQGLNTPICGDDLYGRRADRLHLHAGYIQFVHPTTRQSISFEVKDPF